MTRQTPAALVIGVTLLVAPLLPAALKAQTRTDVIRGRVTTDSGAVVPKAEVFITMAPTLVSVQGAGDSTGRYEIRVPNGTGEYLVYIRATGRTPFRTRVTAVGGDSTFVVDAALAALPTATLGAVHTVAARPRPARSSGLGGGNGLDATDRSPDGVIGQLSPDLANNLNALAATLPGFTMTPDGSISALGMSGATLSTLNGLAVGVGDLPRDAKMTSRFQTSPYDPSKGGFAAAQLGLSFGSGGAISYSRAHLTLDAPQLQVDRAGASLLGEKSYGLIGSFGGDGELVPQKYFYNYAAQVTRSMTPVASLLDLNPSALAPSGVSADSARRLLSILQTEGIPLTASGIPTDRVSTGGSFIARLDRSPQPASTPDGLSSAPWWILATGSARGSDALSRSPVSVPASGSRQRGGSAGLQGFYSTYAGPGRMWLDETMVALAASASHSDPYVALPSGNVLVSSSLADSTQSVRSLAFGGSSASHRRDDAWSAEVVNSVTVYPGTHTTRPFKLFVQGRYDHFDQVVGASRLGTFTFASLDDLASNTPSSFARTLNVPDRHGGEFTGGAALGVNWSIKTVQLVGGLRADANAYTVSPPFNPQVQSLFGLSTDHVPNTIALSPRIGFSWTYKPTGNVVSGGTLSRVSRGPTTIRGGIGRFRNLLSPTLIADALTSTGLPGGATRVTCIGPATPAPDWNGFAIDQAYIPDQCIGVSSTFSDASANVAGFDRRYRPQDAWRATLGSTRTFNKLTYVTLDGTYSLNLGQPSSYDLNFAGTPKMTLLDESGRPVYVGGASIVPSTGVVSPVEDRLSTALGRVIDRRSDLRSEAKQVVLYTIPDVNWFDPFVAVSYAYTDARGQLRGFDATTSGDPRVAVWSRDPYTPRHKVILQTGKIVKGFTVTAFTILQSGTPFTPMVAGDINGDGLANDRAFIFDPATVTDSALSHGLRTLLDQGPSRVRSCLRPQLSMIAGQNSCVGPWSASMNARIGYIKPIPRIGRRVNISVNLANPLAGADLLLHGSNGLYGWGTQRYPDQTLLYVRGFNAATQQFTYEVNPRFGATSPRTTALLNPFRATLDVSFDLGRDAAVQRVRVTVRPPRGMPGPFASYDTIRMRLTNGVGTDYPVDLYRYILSLKDSLALSTDQITKLEQARALYRGRVDSLYTNLAQYMVSLPSDFDGTVVAKRSSETATTAWKMLEDEGPAIRAIMSSAQIQLLAQNVALTIVKGDAGGRWQRGDASWW